MIGGLEHTALSVSDLDRSITFYTELLGFRLKRIIESPPEKGLGRINGLPGCSARIAHLAAGQSMLELFEYEDPRGRPIPLARTQADHGLSHIGLTSTDVRADWERLRRSGVEFLGDPVEFRPGVWVAYFRGPDGEVCEIRQAPEGD